MSAIDDVAAERRRQIDREFWTLKHDDEHVDQSLALAAALYATPLPLYAKDEKDDETRFYDPWPWGYDNGDRLSSANWDKRRTHPRRRQLVIAAALIAAEIDRLDRAALAAAEVEGDGTH